MLGIILLHQLVGVLQEQAQIGDSIVDGGLLFIIELHGQLAGAEIQLVFRDLPVAEIIDDGAVFHLGLGAVHAEQPHRHVEEQCDEHQRGDPVSLFG